jgi:colanic acid biosynthesis glycosyl transferase WcaI
MDAADMLRDNNRIRFLFVGEGQRRSWVESEIARRKLPNMLMKPFQPRERLSESLSAADVHLVSLLPELEHCIVPSKFYGILAAARPTIFIGDTEGEVGTAVRRHGCGAAVSLGDAKGLAEWILNLSHTPARCHSMGENASLLLRQHHSRDNSVQAWAEMLNAFAPAERYQRLSPAR